MRAIKAALDPARPPQSRQGAVEPSAMGKVIFWLVVVFGVAASRCGWSTPASARGAALTQRARDARAPADGRWSGACAAASSCRGTDATAGRRRATPAATRLQARAADGRRALRPTPMQPAPAIPPFEPPPPCRRWRLGPPHPVIVGLYRAVCAALLLGIALLLDLRSLSIAAPNSFVTGAACTSCSASSSFWWVQRDPLPMPLPPAVGAAGRRHLLHRRWCMVAGGGAGGRCRSCCFRSSPRAAGCCARGPPSSTPRSPTVVLLGLDVLARARGPGRRRAALPDRAHRLRLFRDRRHRGRARHATPRRRKTWPRSAASTSPTWSRSTGSSSRTCRTACWSST